MKRIPCSPTTRHSNHTHCDPGCGSAYRPNLLVRTASGSIYEVRHDRKAVRRLRGCTDPTDRVAHGWRKCKTVYIGKTMVIVWPDGTPLLPGSPDDHTPATRTSEVVHVTNAEVPTDD